nr:hypothetical protein [Tanacetum cinerariifolium]
MMLMELSVFRMRRFFTKLARMGYEKPPLKLTFYKAFFSLQWKFLIHTLVQYVSAKRTAWNEFSCSMASAIICLAIGENFNFSNYIFDSMVRNVDNPSKFLMYLRFLQVVLDNQVGDMSSHNKRYTSLALTLKVFANMRRVGKDFSRVETHLFASILEQQTTIFESSMSLLTILMETYASLSQKVAELEKAKHSQALEILQMKKRVKKLEKKNKSKSSGFKRLRRGRINQEEDNAVSKGVNAAQPNIFDDEEVTMTMAQTLIKLKAEKAKLLNEQIA